LSDASSFLASYVTVHRRVHLQVLRMNVWRFTSCPLVSSVHGRGVGCVWVQWRIICAKGVRFRQGHRKRRRRRGVDTPQNKMNFFSLKMLHFAAFSRALVKQIFNLALNRNTVWVTFCHSY